MSDPPGRIPTERLPFIGSNEAPADSQEDLAAKKETRELFGDELREEQVKGVVHSCVIGTIWIIAGTFIVCFVVRSLHLILPEPESLRTASVSCWTPHGWLSATQLQAMDKFFASGVFGALVSLYAKKVLGGWGKE